MLYLPNIFQEIVGKVNEVTAAKTQPFSVFFEYGLFQDVSKKVYAAGQTNYPLVWLMMPYDERPTMIGTDVSCTLIIAMPTDVNYSMAQRENINFFPRLFPIYEELLIQISRSRKLMNTRLEMIEHTKRVLPYWGGDEGGNNTANFSKHYVDAVQIRDLKISVRKQYC